MFLFGTHRLLTPEQEDDVRVSRSRVSASIAVFLSFRICRAVDVCSDQLDGECIAYDSTASSEEERALLMNNVFSANNAELRGLLPSDDNNGEGEDAAIHQ